MFYFVTFDTTSISKTRFSEIIDNLLSDGSVVVFDVSVLPEAASNAVCDACDIVAGN